MRAQAQTEAVWGLWAREPQASAYRVITGPQGWVGAGILLGLLSAFVLVPYWTFAAGLAAMALFNLSIAAFRVYLALLAPGAGKDDAGDQAAIARWPYYSVLVPLFQEARVVPGLARALAGLDYPRDRLEILLICEDDDPETIRAAQRATIAHPCFRVIRVPVCAPRTKPKALNFALAFASGDLAVVYDAEDRPEPDQLRKAAAKFLCGDPHLGCVQARLNYYNARRNWLTRMFALEYALWFDYLLPGLERLGAPIPLGGTSNHFKMATLRRCGAWDPFNVTEDADLGLRLMRHGASVGTLDSTTFEEATSNPRAWVKQRSRWIKGYMQTWLVQMRDPIGLWRDAGPIGFIGFQLFVGGVALTALINPWLWLACIVLTAGSVFGLHVELPSPVEWLATVSLTLGNGALICLSMVGVRRRGWLDLSPYALATPVYWVLISLAGYRALAQLIANPFYWEKTEHGAWAVQALPHAVPMMEAAE
jgi:cellulose synthase/poly-beta-1,6-N-acetylglucosamine synthase-like glycosyltransferase